MSRRLTWVLAMAVCAVATPAVAAQAGSAEATLECLRKNVPTEWSALVEVRIRQADGSNEVRRLAYATRERGRKAEADQWVRMLAPASVAGVVYLFQQRDPGWSRWTYLPALKRVSQVKSQGTSAAALEEIVGVRDIDALMRWPEGAAVMLGEPREQGGRSVRPINATRRVGTGASAGFERMRGVIDVERCVVLEAEWTDPDGRQTRSAKVEPASIRQFGAHWLPQRIDVRQSDGVTAQLRLQRAVIAPPFPSETFDSRRFHTVTTTAVGLE